MVVPILVDEITHFASSRGLKLIGYQKCKEMILHASKSTIFREIINYYLPKAKLLFGEYRRDEVKGNNCFSI